MPFLPSEHLLPVAHEEIIIAPNGREQVNLQTLWLYCIPSYHPLLIFNPFKNPLAGSFFSSELHFPKSSHAF